LNLYRSIFCKCWLIFLWCIFSVHYWSMRVQNIIINRSVYFDLDCLCDRIRLIVGAVDKFSTSGFISSSRFQYSLETLDIRSLRCAIISDRLSWAFPRYKEHTGREDISVTFRSEGYNNLFGIHDNFFVRSNIWFIIFIEKLDKV